MNARPQLAPAASRPRIMHPVDRRKPFIRQLPSGRVERLTADGDWIPDRVGEAQPDTNYSVLPVSSSPEFRMGYTKSAEGISFCAVDADGQPADPPSFTFQATRT